MGRTVIFVYGLVAYILFLVAFLYAIGFVGNLFVPKTIDSGEPGPLGTSLLINAVLLGLFAVQHSIMARIWFKKIWTSVIPKAAERSTFVILASLLLLLLYWQWRPMPQTIWHIESGFFSFLLQALFWIGWLIVLLSTFVINHFDLFGLRQIWLHFKKADYTPLRFKVSLFYKVVRHPLMMGFIIAFWATPHMSQGHLLFSIATTCYILVAIQLEERDLVVYHGTDYLQYRKAVPMLIPLSKSKAQ